MNKSTLAVLLASTLLALPVAAQTGKPQVTILATGGTIAGSSASKTDTTGYKAGAVGIDTLIAAVPEMAQVAEVKGEQISNTISGDVNDQVLLTLSKRVNQLLNQQGQQGVVVSSSRTAPIPWKKPPSSSI